MLPPAFCMSGGSPPLLGQGADAALHLVGRFPGPLHLSLISALCNAQVNDRAGFDIPLAPAQPAFIVGVSLPVIAPCPPPPAFCDIAALNDRRLQALALLLRTHPAGL